MKKIIIGALLITMLFSMFGVFGYIDTHYTRKNCEVIKIDGAMVTAEDCQGNLYSFYANNLELKDKINLEMFNNGTSTIEDDRVENFEKVS